MAASPPVCVGLPVFNGERFLPRALEALLAQSYDNFRVFISDNGSTDGTPEICRRYAAADPRVRYDRLPSNQGWLANWKRVFAQAGQAEYFMWAAHDDVWMPDFIADLVADLEAHPGAGLAMSATRVVDEQGHESHVIRFPGARDPGTMTPYELMKRLTLSGKKLEKYNFFVYGLFRTAFLRKAIRWFGDSAFPEREFMTHLSLATGWRYVDRVLYQRTTYARNTRERHPHESFTWMHRQRLARLRSFLRFGGRMLLSDLIPLRRKPFVPLAIWRIGGYYRAA